MICGNINILKDRSGLIFMWIRLVLEDCTQRSLGILELMSWCDGMEF